MKYSSPHSWRRFIIIGQDARDAARELLERKAYNFHSQSGGVSRDESCVPQVVLHIGTHTIATIVSIYTRLHNFAQCCINSRTKLPSSYVHDAQTCAHSWNVEVSLYYTSARFPYVVSSLNKIKECSSLTEGNEILNTYLFLLPLCRMEVQSRMYLFSLWKIFIL